MTLEPEAEERDQNRCDHLNVLCAPLGQGWRIYAAPRFMPLYLARCFDRRLEAHAAALDWEDLDRYMKKHGAQYEKHVSKNDCVELTARGSAVRVLATWLTMALGSGERG